MVAYATHIKTDVLGVDPTLIEKHSVVSQAVAQAMALKSNTVFGESVRYCNHRSSRAKKQQILQQVWVQYALLLQAPEVFFLKNLTLEIQERE